MTTQRLEPGVSGLPAAEAAPGDDALGALFESSPARVVRTSAAAEVAFLSGLLAVLSVPFSLMSAVCVGLSAVGVVASIVGLARASRPAVSGGLLASIGLVLSLATLTLVGLRYLGIDTAVGDPVVPTLTDWLAALNTLLPTP
jgi:hypothetical protein